MDLLVPALGADRAPESWWASNAMGERAVDDVLHELGARTGVTPVKANPSRPAGASNTAARSVGRQLAHRLWSPVATLTCATGRTEPDRRHRRTRVGAGQEVLAHNLVKIAALVGDRPGTERRHPHHIQSGEVTGSARPFLGGRCEVGDQVDANHAEQRNVVARRRA